MFIIRIYSCMCACQYTCSHALSSMIISQLRNRFHWLEYVYDHMYRTSSLRCATCTWKTDKALFWCTPLRLKLPLMTCPTSESKWQESRIATKWVASREQCKHNWNIYMWCWINKLTRPPFLNWHLFAVWHRFPLCLLGTSAIWKMKELLVGNRDKTSHDNGETRKPVHECMYVKELILHAAWC